MLLGLFEPKIFCTIVFQCFYVYQQSNESSCLSLSFFLNGVNFVSFSHSTEQEELVRSFERIQARQSLLWRVSLIFTGSSIENGKKIYHEFVIFYRQ